MRASDLKLTAELRQDLEEVLRRHGGKLESLGHPTTTLEDLFLRIVRESQAHPGRRYLPAADRPAPAAVGPKPAEQFTEAPIGSADTDRSRIKERP
jgi:ABC-2 type transport system ATP-binding protein